MLPAELTATVKEPATPAVTDDGKPLTANELATVAEGKLNMRTPDDVARNSKLPSLLSVIAPVPRFAPVVELRPAPKRM